MATNTPLIGLKQIKYVYDGGEETPIVTLNFYVNSGKRLSELNEDQINELINLITDFRDRLKDIQKEMIDNR